MGILRPVSSWTRALSNLRILRNIYDRPSDKQNFSLGSWTRARSTTAVKLYVHSAILSLFRKKRRDFWSEHAQWWRITAGAPTCHAKERQKRWREKVEFILLYRRDLRTLLFSTNQNQLKMKLPHGTAEQSTSSWMVFAHKQTFLQFTEQNTKIVHWMIIIQHLLSCIEMSPLSNIYSPFFIFLDVYVYSIFRIIIGKTNRPHFLAFITAKSK